MSEAVCLRVAGKYPSTMKKTANETSSTVWDRYYARGATPWKSTGLHALVRRYISMYAPGGDVLEIGCGSGEDAGCFIDSNFKYVGIDISKEAIRAARTLTGKPRAFSVADFFTWKLPKTFSILYDKGVFHNLAGPKRRRLFVER